MNKKLVNILSGGFGVFMIMLILVLGCGRFGGSNDGVVSDDFGRKAFEIPTYTKDTPLPSPGALAVRHLAELDPRFGELVPMIEAAERATLIKMLKSNKTQGSTSNGTQNPKSALLFKGGRIGQSAMLGLSLPPLVFLQTQSNQTTPNSSDVGVITAVMNGWSDQFTKSVTEKGAKTGDTYTETENGVKTTYTSNLGRNSDGSTSFGLSIQSEATKNGVAVKTDVASSLDGQRCPTVDGQVSFTMKLRITADSGGSGYTQELTAFVRAETNDDATIASSTLDLIQGTRQVKEGREVYVESGVTMKENGPKLNGSNATQSNWREIRHSQQASRENADPLSRAGLDAAYLMGLTALATAERTWLDGGCTQIKATSPGNVQPNSSTSIPVTVQHRFDGSEVPSKLDAVLSGGASVDPTTLAKTAGTLTYTAPSESRKRATIALTATSRRGRSKLDLTANTNGSAYRIIGGLDDWKTNTVVCDIMKPFTLTGGGITMSLTGGLSGAYEYTGPFHSHGTGRYTISLPNGLGEPGTMIGSGEGYAEGHKGSGTEKYTLTPLDKCD